LRSKGGSMASLRYIVLLAFLCCALSTQAKVAIDLYESTSSSTFGCINATVTTNHVIVRASRSSEGNVDLNARSNIQNAWQAGVQRVDIYMSTCPSCSKQVESMLMNLVNVSYDTVWIKIQDEGDWSPSQLANQQVFEGLLDDAVAFNSSIKLGVLTTKQDWENIMGATYIVGSKFPLWYIFADNKQNFVDFTSFGGWVSPTLKQYRQATSICAIPVNSNYFP